MRLILMVALIGAGVTLTISVFALIVSIIKEEEDANDGKH